ncbi:hypothetical protein MBLNU13_g05599t1 [Cladosporium sp. NU13]
MPPKTAVGPDEDVKFLLAVIKQLSGTPDWQKVSDELGLTSKGAAAKRYSRLPAKYDVTMPSKTSASPDAEDAPKTPKKTKGKAAPKKPTASAKKRKVAEAEAEDEDVEEDVKAESDD